MQAYRTRTKEAAMSIYITGDCHGDYRRFGTEIFPEQKELTKDDYVIICGDFGYWSTDREQLWWRKWLEQKPFTTLWVDGNHENYDLLAACPVSEWHGGKVQYVMPSVIHLMRGQVYTIDGCRIFTFGGAQSHDIQGGILELDDPDFKVKKKQLDKESIPYRINHISWWKEELPSEDQCAEGLRNIEACGGRVDYVITHCAPTKIQDSLGRYLYQPDHLTDYLQKVEEQLRFKKWFFGHYHDNRNVTGQHILLYEQIIRIW